MKSKIIEEEKNQKDNKIEKEENSINNNPFNNSNSIINHKRQKTQFKIGLSAINENNQKINEEYNLKNKKDILSGYINIMNKNNILMNKGNNSSQKSLILNKNSNSNIKIDKIVNEKKNDISNNENNN